MLPPPRSGHLSGSTLRMHPRDTSGGGECEPCALGGSAVVLDARRVPVTVPFRTQHPLGAVVNRPSVWSDR